jgi:hypothetical protein
MINMRELRVQSRFVKKTLHELPFSSIKMFKKHYYALDSFLYLKVWNFIGKSNKW